MKQITFLFVLFATLHASAQMTFVKTIYFETNKSDIEKIHIQTLEEVASIFQNPQLNSIAIYGVTDTSATDAFNIALSKKRAENVYQYLKSNTTPVIKEPTKVSVHWIGESIPDIQMVKLHYKQRCVDIVITLNAPESEKKEEVVAKEVPDISELYKFLLPEPQSFCINPNRDTVLTGEQGTFILIKSNSFNLRSLMCTPYCIEITLREVFDKSSILLNNLNTLSNGQLLESRFMMEIRAYACEQELSLNSNAELQIFTPVRGQEKYGGQLFYGGLNDNHQFNWEQSGNNQITTQTGLLPNMFSGLIEDNPQTCPFFFCKINRYFLSVFRSGEGNSSQTMDNSEINEFEKKFNKGTADYSKVEYYAFSTTELGWINNDKFLKLLPDKKTDLVVQGEQGKNIDVKIVFKAYNSVYSIPPVMKGDYVYEDVGIGEPIWIVGFKYDEDKIYLAMKETVIAKDRPEPIEFIEVESIDKLKAALEKLNTPIK